MLNDFYIPDFEQSMKMCTQSNNCNVSKLMRNVIQLNSHKQFDFTINNIWFSGIFKKMSFMILKCLLS